MIYVNDGYCPTCGAKLERNGTVTEMVPAVTPEAVREARLWGLLQRVADGKYIQPEDRDALVTLGLVSQNLFADAGRTIFAALAGQSADTRRLDALEKNIKFRGTGYAGPDGEFELDEVHAIVLDLEELDDDGDTFCDCDTVRDYLDALLSQATPA